MKLLKNNQSIRELKIKGTSIIKTRIKFNKKELKLNDLGVLQKIKSN